MKNRNEERILLKNCEAFTTSLKKAMREEELKDRDKELKELLAAYKNFYVSYKDFYTKDSIYKIKNSKCCMEMIEKLLKSSLFKEVDNLNSESFSNMSKVNKNIQYGIYRLECGIREYKKEYEKKHKRKLEVEFEESLTEKITKIKNDLESFEDNDILRTHLSKVKELKAKYLSKSEDESVLFSIARNGDKDLSDEGVEELKSWLDDWDKNTSVKLNNLKDILVNDKEDIKNFLKKNLKNCIKDYKFYLKEKKSIPCLEELKAVKTELSSKKVKTINIVNKLEKAQKSLKSKGKTIGKEIVDIFCKL